MLVYFNDLLLPNYLLFIFEVTFVLVAVGTIFLSCVYASPDNNDCEDKHKKMISKDFVETGGEKSLDFPCAVIFFSLLVLMCLALVGLDLEFNRLVFGINDLMLPDATGALSSTAGAPLNFEDNFLGGMANDTSVNVADLSQLNVVSSNIVEVKQDMLALVSSGDSSLAMVQRSFELHNTYVNLVGRDLGQAIVATGLEDQSNLSIRAALEAELRQVTLDANTAYERGDNFNENTSEFEQHATAKLLLDSLSRQWIVLEQLEAYCSSSISIDLDDGLRPEERTLLRKWWTWEEN